MHSLPATRKRPPPFTGSSRRSGERRQDVRRGENSRFIPLAHGWIRHSVDIGSREQSHWERKTGPKRRVGGAALRFDHRNHRLFVTAPAP